MPPIRRNRALALLVCLSVALGASPGAGEAQTREGFSEKVAVREVELVFELPSLPLLSSGTFGPEDLIVVEDGQVRTITKVGSIEDGTVRSRFQRTEVDTAFEAPPWTAVVWIDRALASPETVFSATLGLAGRAAELAGLGAVEVVVVPEDDAEDLLLVAGSTREPKRLEQILADLAGQARIERDRAEGAAPKPRTGEPRPDAATLRRRLDRLLVHLAGRTDTGPRVLFLVADGFNIEPVETRAFETGVADPKAGERAGAILDAARLLASYGWVTVALPLRRESLGREDRSPSDADRFRHNSGAWGPVNNSVPPMIPPRRPKDTKLKWDLAVDSLVRMDLAPLRALTGPTGGTLVAQDGLLSSALAGLESRWHLYYQTQMPADGRLRPIEVRMRNGSPVRSRRWVRSSTPEGIAEARLRRLLAGDRLAEGLPLRVEAGRITIGAFASSEPAVPGPVRISVAWQDGSGSLGFRHVLAAGLDAPESGWSAELPADLPADLPPGARPLAVLVEDLARERWSARRIDLSPPGSPPGAP